MRISIALKCPTTAGDNDYHFLSLLHSTKGRDESGKFGEGLKMLSVAALRANSELVIESRNWEAVPRLERQTIDDKEISQLVYDARTYLKEGRGKFHERPEKYDF